MAATVAGATWRKPFPRSVITIWNVVNIIHQTNDSSGHTRDKLLDASPTTFLELGQSILEDEHLWRQMPKEVEMTIGEVACVRGALEELGIRAIIPDRPRYVSRENLRKVLEHTLAMSH